MKLKIGKLEISSHSKPFIIAEIGVNHENSIEKAKTLIMKAKEGGASAVKFQSYKAETLASKKSSPSYWDLNKEPTKSQYELFKKYDSFSEKEYEELYFFCKEIDIEFSSTPFDLESVEYLNYYTNFFKVASADLTCTPLLRAIGSKKKPVILSTGCSNIEEINHAIKTLKSSGANDIALLHCILNYPTSFENANLLMISHLKEQFPKHLIGYSDHTLPDKNMETLTTSFLLGARIIEKHFTDDKKQKGNDHYHAMDIDDLKTFTKKINFVHQLIGNSKNKMPIPSEEIAKQNARRSIVFRKNMKKGDIINEDSITFKRPGFGISPVKWDSIIGRKLISNKSEDDILYEEDLN